MLPHAAGRINQLNEVLPVPIELDTPADLHASSITDVLVGDHHIIGGDASTGGALYVVWLVRIVLKDARYSSIVVYKRYRDFEKLRSALVHEFRGHDIPPLPPKDSLSFQRVVMSNEWLEHRRKGLQWFMTNVLLNPKYQNSENVKAFIFNKP